MTEQARQAGQEKEPGGLTVCFTGHRHMERQEALRLPSLLDVVIRELYERGARVFRAGGAQGFDTVAALKVLELREQLPEIRLALILPCRDQTAGWDAAAVRTYRYIYGRADARQFLFDRYIDGCMLERDRRLVEGSDICVAFCTRSRGGTAYTCACALRAGLELINLYDRMPADMKKERGRNKS